MAQTSHLYPLLAKPGIVRDGTPFQEDYWTDGQWVRFQRGLPRTIGGYESIIKTKFSTMGLIDAIYSFNISNNNFILFIQKKQNEQDIDKLICLKNGNIFININLSTSGLNINSASFSFYGPISISPKNADRSNTTTHFLINITYDNFDILSEDKSKIYLIPIFENIYDIEGYHGFEDSYEIELSEIIDPMTKRNGICNSSIGYIENRLFVCGINGLLAWSAPNLLNFKLVENDDNKTVTGAGTFNCGSSKVLHFMPIRGGAQSPTLLAWTQSSLLRLLNVNETEPEIIDGVETPELFYFKQEIISDDISLISKKSIVSYDGLVYWIGTDRFYVYNGTCQEIPNNLNKNFFFENIHPDRYNQLCGTINPRFGEIWWFYSHKDDPGSESRNTRVLIYNKMENTWVDSKINRDSCCYDHHKGKMLASGKEIDTDKTNIWIHDVGTKQKIENVEKAIPSLLTSPTMSWASISPLKKHTGLNIQIELDHIEPSFNFYDSSKQSTINVSVITRKYPASNPIVGNSKIIREDPVTEKLEIKTKGRFIQLMFSSEFSWEMGKILCLFKSEGEN